MSLSRKIAAAVDAAPAGATLPAEFAAESGPRRLALHVTATGPVGLAFDRLDFSAGTADLSAPDLKSWGDRLAAKLTYLMEPLVVLEHDVDGGEVDLRSQSPSGRDGLRSFYEVRLRRDGSLQLGRVCFDDSDRRRRPATCQMTREVLDRLVDDIEASVD